MVRDGKITFENKVKQDTEKFVSACNIALVLKMHPMFSVKSEAEMTTD